jgi:hypothetical protein
VVGEHGAAHLLLDFWEGAGVHRVDATAHPAVGVGGADDGVHLNVENRALMNGNAGPAFRDLLPCSGQRLVQRAQDELQLRLRSLCR